MEEKKNITPQPEEKIEVRFIKTKRKKEKNSPTIIRRTEIPLKLFLIGKINTKELAEEYGVSRRTIQKDIERLKSGTLYDLIEEDKKTGTYTLKKNRKDSAITEFEKYINTSMINLLYSSIIKDEELKKSGTNFKQALIESFVLVKPDCKKIEKEKMYELITKIMAKFPITITYKNRKGETKEYDVHPYKLILLGNYWYLVAKDISDNKIKLFQADKIMEITHCSEAKESEIERQKAMEKIIEITSPWFEEGSLKKATLKIEGEAKQYLEDNLPPNSQLIEANEQYLLISYGYYHIDEATNFIKKWLPDITPTDTPELKEKVRSMINEYLNKEV